METDYDFATQQALVTKRNFEQAHAIDQYVANVRETIKVYAPALSTVGPAFRSEIIKQYEANVAPHAAAVKFIDNFQQG